MTYSNAVLAITEGDLTQQQLVTILLLATGELKKRSFSLCSLGDIINHNYLKCN